MNLDEAYAEAGIKPASARRGKKPEHVLQVACSQWLKEALPPAVIWTAVDHGSYFGGGKDAGIRMWAQLKARGVKTGIPDFHFWHAGIYLAVEMKTGRGTTEGDQDEWIAALEREGFRASVARSVSELERHLRDAGFPVRTSAKGIDERLPLREPSLTRKRSSKPRTPRPSSRALVVAARFHKR